MTTVHSNQPHALNHLAGYELAVQNPGALAHFLHALAQARHIHHPILLEDFCGTAALCRAWMQFENCAAIGLDLDDEALSFAASQVSQNHKSRLTLRQSDCVLERTVEGLSISPDLIYVGNFSLGYIHLREDLKNYFLARDLLLGHKGIMVVDLAVGTNVTTPSVRERTIHVPANHPIRSHHLGETEPCVLHSTFVHEWYNPVSHISRRSLHLALLEQTDAGKHVLAQKYDAFTYLWRMWGVQEVIELVTDALPERSCTVKWTLSLEPEPPLDPADGPEHLPQAVMLIIH